MTRQTVLSMIDKTFILEKLISHHEQLVTELNKTILDLSAEADLPENETVDIEDSSYQNYASDMRLHYNELLTNSINDLEKLKSYEGLSTREVGPGALVVTDPVMFFIGVATPRLHLKTYQTLIGISPGSDMYKILLSKKEGEEIMFELGKVRIKAIL
ncbi:MAG: hypothetical protein ABI761_04445 [Saprospiraceae bacterium]